MNRKGTSNLFQKVISVESLRNAAFVAYKNAETKTRSMKVFMDNLDEEIELLHQQLTNWTYMTSPYRTFIVHEPKTREIKSLPFRDRVVHHACMLELLPIWMKKFTKDTYNCLKGRGTHGFVRAIKHVIRDKKEMTKYVLQIDVHHFYESIDHDTLKRIIAWTIKDKDLMKLLYQIIDTVPNGVPIGNYLSQFFATLYLTPFDHYVKEVLKARLYFRYCDDIICFASTKEELWRILRGILAYMQTIHLEIKPNMRIFPLETGLDVVGYVFYPDHTLLRKRNKLKFERKCAKAHQEGLTGKAFKCKIGSYLGLLRHCNSINLKRKWLGKDYEICMTKFSEIAQEEDTRHLAYEGESVSITSLVNKKIIMNDVREVVIHNKKKIVAQIEIDGDKKYFFTGAERLHDLLLKYKENMPFETTIIEVLNPKTSNTYYSLS